MAPKGVDVEQALADWLVSWGVLNKIELSAVNKDTEKTTINKDAWDLFQAGQAVSNLLTRIHYEETKDSSLTFSMNGGRGAETVYNNWDQIDDYLKKQHGIEISRKELCLICAGESGPVEATLNELRSRTAGTLPSDKLQQQQLDADGDGKIDAPQKRKMDTADTKDQVLALIAVVGTAYKMMLATLLLVFTPQQCGLTTCTQRQNIENAYRVAKPVIFVNFGTLLLYMIGELIVFMRERFVIRYFASDDTLAEDNIESEIEFYPRLKSKLRAMTWNCYIFSILMLVVEFGNFGYSIWVLRVKFGVKIQTIIQVVANVLLVTGKVSGYITVSRAAIKKPGAVVSLTLTEPKESNTIDDEFKGQDGWFVVQPEGDPELVAVTK